MSLPKIVWSKIEGPLSSFITYAKLKFYPHRNKILFGVCIILSLMLFLRKGPTPSSTVTAKDTEPILMKARELKDKNDHLYSRLEQMIIDQGTAKRYSDSLALALRVKPKYIKGVDKIIYYHDTTFIKGANTVVVKNDTVSKITHKDGWVNIEAEITNGKEHINFSSTDTLTRTVISRPHLFKADEHYITISNKNPYNKIVSGYSWVEKEKKPWLVIGPSVSYSLLPNKGITVGISAVIPIISIKKK